jgi:twinkle protein
MARQDRHGKSSLMGHIWFNTVTTHETGIVVATFENHPMPSYRKKLRQFWAGMPEHAMDDRQRAQADHFIHDHYRFVIHPQERPTLDWLLEQAAKAVDFSVLIIDPWNRIESQRRKDETETEYIAWCLSEMRLFAVAHNCHVMIIAHPAKRDPKFRDRVPFLEDISGSKHWDNMPDQGFVVHRAKFWDAETNARNYDVTLYHLKAREEELGYPCAMPMRLNARTQRFECTFATAGPDE